MTPVRILLIIPELIPGGAQRSVSKLSFELAKRHKVWLVIFNQNDKVAYEFGGELRSLDVVPGRGLVRKFLAFAHRIIRLRKLKRELAIDVAISFLEGADYVNILSCVGERVVLSIRGSKIHDETMAGRMEWLRKDVLIPWLYQKADVLVTVNHGIASELKSYFKLPASVIVTIGNFYDPEEIRRLSEESRSDVLEKIYSDPILVTTGRLAPEKGLPTLLRIFHGVRATHRDVRLILVGDGPCRDEIMQACRALDLEVCTESDLHPGAAVILAGGQTNVYKYLRGATLYLMNSSSEGFPNGLAEAMICGVPVAAADCPYGPREILDPEFSYEAPVAAPRITANGVLMPMVRSDAERQMWVDTICKLLKSGEELAGMAARGRERMAHFDQRLVMHLWERILGTDA